MQFISCWLWEQHWISGIIVMWETNHVFFVFLFIHLFILDIRTAKLVWKACLTSVACTAGPPTLHLDMNDVGCSLHSW